MATEALVSDSIVYEGIVPAADTYGIKYTISIPNDSTTGFSVRQAYMSSKTQERSEVYQYTGKVETKEQDGKKYLVLKLDKDETLRLLQVNDSTLRMVGKDWQESSTGQDFYDLKLK